MRAVFRGLERRSLVELTYFGLDEKTFGRDHDYIALLHNIQGKRVLDVVPEHTREAANTLWATIPEAQRQGIAACAKGTWEPYMESTRASAPNSSIVHNKFHVAKKLHKAVDLVRRKEHRELMPQSEKTPTKTKDLWLKYPRTAPIVSAAISPSFSSKS